MLIETSNFNTDLLLFRECIRLDTYICQIQYSAFLACSFFIFPSYLRQHTHGKSQGSNSHKYYGRLSEGEGGSHANYLTAAKKNKEKSFIKAFIFPFCSLLSHQ